VAKGDECFCRLDTNFVLHDPRFGRLSGDEAKVYIIAWATAVSIRRERLPSDYDAHYFARVSGLGVTRVRQCLAKLCRRSRSGSGEGMGEGEKGVTLLTRDASRAITVCRVTSKHAKLTWKDGPHTPPVSDLHGGGISPVSPPSKSNARVRARMLIRGRAITENYPDRIIHSWIFAAKRQREVFRQRTVALLVQRP